VKRASRRGALVFFAGMASAGQGSMAVTPR
jgi:hypothetical protein